MKIIILICSIVILLLCLIICIDIKYHYMKLKYQWKCPVCKNVVFIPWAIHDDELKHICPQCLLNHQWGDTIIPNKNLK